MKRGLLIIMFLCILGAAGFAQENREKLKAMKVAYFTEKLSLTPQEAESFWPLYNDWEKKHYDLKKQERTASKKVRENFDSLSDSEMENLINKQLDIKQSQLDLIREYNTKYKSALPMKKIALLYTVERQWKRELLKKLHHHHQER